MFKINVRLRWVIFLQTGRCGFLNTLFACSLLTLQALLSKCLFSVCVLCHFFTFFSLMGQMSTRVCFFCSALSAFQIILSSKPNFCSSFFARGSVYQWEPSARDWGRGGRPRRAFVFKFFWFCAVYCKSFQSRSAAALLPEQQVSLTLASKRSRRQRCRKCSIQPLGIKGFFTFL